MPKSPTPANTLPDLHLLPYPASVKSQAGVFRLPTKGVIYLEPSAKSEVFTAARLRDALPKEIKSNFKVVSALAAKQTPAITLRKAKNINHPQGYRLVVLPSSILLEAGTSAGLFYAAMTLLQLIRQYNKQLPLVTISDQPTFPRRGVYVDVSRGKVPNLKTLLMLVNDLATLKINEFQLYIENVYAFKKHPAMYADTDPLTAEELQKIDAACKERFIDFVPSLTSLGHFDKILRLPEYRPLAEAEPADLKKQGVETWSEDPWSLNVTNPKAQKLLKEMYDDFLPNFSSPHFNICCDESWDLGKGKSKPEADKIGVGQLYVNWVDYCATLAKKHGKRIQMWGDIILRHPELIPALPQDAILLEWGYEADHKFAEHCAIFGKSGRDFYVAPGTSTWLSFAGRTNNAFGNLRSAAIHGHAHGAIGFLNTDWGDHGHQQLLAVSLLPYAAGAALSWNEKTNSDAHIIAAADTQLFRSATHPLAQLAADLGQTYERIGFQRFNGSTDFFLFREPWNTFNYVTRMTADDLQKTLDHTTELLHKIKKAQSHRPDGKLVVAELALTAATIIYTCRRSLLRKDWDSPGRKQIMQWIYQDLGEEAERLAKRLHTLWLDRNKPSRLLDVLYHFTRHQADYHSAWQGKIPR